MRNQYYKIINTKIARVFLFAGISTALLSSCKKDSSNPVQTTPTATDASFMMNASYSNLAEIAAAKLAQTNGGDTSVKNFGTFMITEHTQSQADLMALALKKSVTLPTAPDSAHQAMAKMLATMTGAKFDSAYIKAQIADHQKAQALFTTGTQSGDADVKSYANKYLPHINMHLQMADTIKQNLKIQ